ncbi:MAG: methylated-DNA--[protein]-cysteine S-methyltransferase [Chloroflexi bacterium]|nr:methylated-DNA--[protein]-cysteine S-methyltransferase [Chloroflexota bacterium]
MTTVYGEAFITSRGWLGMAASDHGITLVTRPWPNKEEALREMAVGKTPMLSPLHNAAQGISDLVARLAEKIAAYFEGSRVAFDEPIDLAEVSNFDRQVLEMTREIGYGEVRSYAWVAACIGRPRSARAVGQALHRNPVPIIIPCHRVVASNGELRGFRWGIETKSWLLDLERAART